MIICIVLAILLVLIIGYAAMNDGRLWGEPENYQDKSCQNNYDCCDSVIGMCRRCVNNKCK